MNRFDYLPNHRYYSNTEGIITDSNGKPLRGYSISGENVGDYDETTGKYIIPIQVCGKNLLNKTDVKWFFGYFTNTIQTITSHGAGRMLYIPCKPNTTYTISRTEVVAIQFYFGSCEVIPAVGVTVSNANSSTTLSNTITTLENDKYLVFYGFNGYAFSGIENESWERLLSTLQIEEGATATEYEEFKGNIYNIYLDAPLTGVIDSTLDKTLPVIMTNKGYNNIMVCTSKQPDNVLWQYYK